MKNKIKDISKELAEYRSIYGDNEVEEFHNVELNVLSCNCTKGIDCEFLLCGDEKTDYELSEYYLDLVRDEDKDKFPILKDMLEAWVNGKKVVVSGVKTYPSGVGTCCIEICEYEVKGDTNAR